MHSDTQVGAFDVTGGYPGVVGLSHDDIRHCCNDIAASVPFWARFQAPVNLPQLGEVYISTKPLLDCSDIPAKGISSDLVHAFGAFAQVFNKGKGIDRVPCSDMVGQNHLALTVQCKPRPLVAPRLRRTVPEPTSMTAAVCPKLIKLDVCGPDIADSLIKHSPGIASSSVHQSKYCFEMQTSETRDCSNAGTFQHHAKSTNGSIRVGVMIAYLGGGVRERGGTVGASVSLYLALTVEAETLHGIMLTTLAGHIILALSRRRGLLLAWVGIAGHSACRTTLSLVRASGRALNVGVTGGPRTHNQRITNPPLFRIELPSPQGQGIQGFAPKNALRLFSQWWRSRHSSAPFQWIEHINSFLRGRFRAFVVSKAFLPGSQPFALPTISAKCSITERLNFSGCDKPFYNAVNGSHWVGLRVEIETCSNQLVSNLSREKTVRVGLAVYLSNRISDACAVGFNGLYKTRSLAVRQHIGVGKNKASQLRHLTFGLFLLLVPFVKLSERPANLLPIRSVIICHI
jgi:hypothetical protein